MRVFKRLQHMRIKTACCVYASAFSAYAKSTLKSLSKTEKIRDPLRDLLSAYRTTSKLISTDLFVPKNRMEMYHIPMILFSFNL